MINEKETKEPKYSWFTYFFWWCSGSVIRILKEQPTEKNKYVGIGAAIFGTWILATLSGIFAFETVFSSAYISVPLGIIYGLIIFNLDRFITSSMKKVGSETEIYLSSERAWNFIYFELLPAIPRILIALLIGIAISKPLELKLFEYEIQEQLELDNEVSLKDYSDLLDEQNIEEKGKLEGEIEALKTEKNAFSAFINQKQNELNMELGGKNIGKRGEGVISQNIRIEIHDAKNERQKTEAQIETLNDQLLTNELLKKEQVQQFEKEQLSKIGFFKKMEALSNLTKDPAKPTIWWANLIIVFLIVLIEMAPVLVKLISVRGPYDAALDYYNRKIMIELDREIKEIKYKE